MKSMEKRLGGFNPHKKAQSLEGHDVWEVVGGHLRKSKSYPKPEESLGINNMYVAKY